MLKVEWFASLCVYNDDNPNKRTMKRLILFSMVCLMATATQAQNETLEVANDSVGRNIKEGETLQEVTVKGSKVVQRMATRCCRN